MFDIFGQRSLGSCRFQASLSVQVGYTPTNLLIFTSMKMSEIKELSTLELQKKLRELGDELLQLQIRKQTGQVEKPHLIKSIRRDRARILTTLSQGNS